MEILKVERKNIIIMAKYLKADGTEQEILPVDGKKFTLNELRTLVGGTIDIQVNRGVGSHRKGSKRCMVVNDNGKLDGSPVNEAASKIWREWYPIEIYPHNNDGTIVGDVLLCNVRQIR